MLYRQLIGASGALAGLLDKQSGQLPVLLRPAILLAVEALIVFVLGDVATKAASSSRRISRSLRRSVSRINMQLSSNERPLWGLG